MKLCLGKINFIVMGISALLILVGFVLMGGASSTPEHFNPEVFSDQRVIVGPNVCFVGYLLMIVGIMLPSKGRKQAAEADHATTTA
jgi:uncharacterized membrane protein